MYIRYTNTNAAHKMNFPCNNGWNILYTFLFMCEFVRLEAI